MSDLQVLTNERLSNLIKETQATLDELKDEVERRENAQQEHEIMNLENHMKSAELNLASIRNFLQFLIGDKKA